MKLTIYLHPGSSKNAIEKLSDDSYKVRVTAQPVDGEANEALIEILADHFDVPKTSIEITHGLKSKTKTVELQIETEA